MYPQGFFILIFLWSGLPAAVKAQDERLAEDDRLDYLQRAQESAWMEAWEQWYALERPFAPAHRSRTRSLPRILARPGKASERQAQLEVRFDSLSPCLHDLLSTEPRRSQRPFPLGEAEGKR